MSPVKQIIFYLFCLFLITLKPCYSNDKELIRSIDILKVSSPVPKMEKALTVPCMLLFQTTPGGTALYPARVQQLDRPYRLGPFEIASISSLTRNSEQIELNESWLEAEKTELLKLSFDYDRPYSNFSSLSRLADETSRIVTHINETAQFRELNKSSATVTTGGKPISPSKVIASSLEIALSLLVEFYERADPKRLASDTTSPTSALDLAYSSVWLLSHYRTQNDTDRLVDYIDRDLHQVEFWVAHAAIKFEEVEVAGFESPLKKVIHRLRDAIYLWHSRVYIDKFAPRATSSGDTLELPPSSTLKDRLSVDEIEFLYQQLSQALSDSSTEPLHEIIYLETGLSLLWQTRLMGDFLSQGYNWRLFMTVWNRLFIRTTIMIRNEVTTADRYAKKHVQNLRSSMIHLWQEIILPKWGALNHGDPDFRVFVDNLNSYIESHPH